MKPTLEPMDATRPDRRRMVYVSAKPEPNWINHLIDGVRLTVLCALSFAALYLAWSMTR